MRRVQRGEEIREISRKISEKCEFFPFYHSLDDTKMGMIKGNVNILIARNSSGTCSS